MTLQPDVPGQDDPGAGRRLGLDVGTVRIGVALSDREATLAMPLETVARETGLKDRDKGDIDRIIQHIVDNNVAEVVVGLPRDLKGHGSTSVKHAKDIAFRIRRRLLSEDPEFALPADAPRPPVRMADERLTTVAATHALRASGVSEREGRKVIDQAAAVEILQSWLDGRAAALRRASNSPTEE